MEDFTLLFFRVTLVTAFLAAAAYMVHFVAQGKKVRTIARVLMILCGMATLFPWVGHGVWRIHETRRALEAGRFLDIGGAVG